MGGASVAALAIFARHIRMTGGVLSIGKEFLIRPP